jgi:release factor glutamine methyltransferase
VADRSPQTSSMAHRHEGFFRRAFNDLVHFLSYHFILNSRRTKRTRKAGFDLTVRPSVFHPGWFVTSEFFAEFIGGLDIKGKRVADLCTGSGILALAAARAGAAHVLAVDINPNAAADALQNARINGLGDRVSAACCNLFAGVAARPLFDVIVSNPPYFAGEPRNVADRAWYAGPGYRDILSLFEQARERLKPGGRVYALFSSQSDLGFLETLAGQAGFAQKRVAEHSIVIESFLVFELWVAAEVRDLAGATMTTPGP